MTLCGFRYSPNLPRAFREPLAIVRYQYSQPASQPAIVMALAKLVALGMRSAVSDSRIENKPTSESLQNVFLS
jgi:hypothetical protein